jgi:hypothetical protein
MTIPDTNALPAPIQFFSFSPGRPSDTDHIPHKSGFGGQSMAAKTYTLFVNSAEAEVRCDPAQISITDQKREHSKILIRNSDIDRADWITIGQLGTLHLFTRKDFYSISGFRQSDSEGFLEYLRNSLGVQPTISQASISGGNSGSLELQDSGFGISADGFPILRIPYARINQVQSTSPTDLVLNFIADRDGESLSALRLSVHEKGPQNAKELLAILGSRTDLTVGTDEFIAQLRGVDFTSPRQRFDVRFCRELLFLSNDAASHRIAYDSISTVHRLDAPSEGEADGHDEFLVISLIQPIRQGQSAYSHLVLKTGDGDPVEGDGLTHPDWSLATYFCHFCESAGVQMIPQTGFFEGLQGGPGIFCTYKGKQGVIYLTPKAFLYLYNPVLYIPYMNITALVFERLSSDTSRYNRAFDMTLHERTKKTTFANVDLIAGVNIGISSAGDEREQMETAKKEKSFQALKELVAFLEKKNVPIDKVKQLKKQLKTIVMSTETGTRVSKLDAELKTRDELKALGSGGSDDSESDRDFNPDAPAEEAGAGSGEEDEEEEGDEGDEGGEAASGDGGRAHDGDEDD